MDPEKARRSLRRFHRRLASYRRSMVRHIHETAHAMSPWQEREVVRIPTRQELRVDEAFRQDLREVEIV